MPTAGYLAVVQTGGTPTALSGEPTTDVGGAHTTYQITDAAHRVLDPDTAVVVKVGGSAAVPQPTVDLYTGKAVFGSSQGAGVVTFDGKYIPLLTIATARKASIKLARDTADATAFNATGFRSKAALLGSCSGSLDLLEDLLVDHDAGAGEVALATLIRAGTVTLLTLRPVATGPTLRTWAILSGSTDIDPGALITSGLTFESAGKAPAPALSLDT